MSLVSKSTSHFQMVIQIRLEAEFNACALNSVNYQLDYLCIHTYVKTWLQGPNGESFHGGLLTASQQYFDCRADLRAEHLKFWLNFISLLPDLFSAIGFAFDGMLFVMILVLLPAFVF